MYSQQIEQLESDDLKKIIAEKKEKQYTIIDVREDFEYKQNHIPGSSWIKLSEIENNPEIVPEASEVIFYCRTGARSMAAAKLFAESKKSEKTDKILNLKSGIIGWDGAELEIPPKIDLFKGKTSVEDLIIRGMELEKGAYNFYSYIYDNYKELPYIDTINVLRKAETAHARTLYKRLDKPAEEFDSFFDSLNGDILESGMNTKEAVNVIESFSGNFCINILEFLLLIEVSAYDLYKVISEKSPETKDTFLLIAQEEKAHMRSIASSFVLCA
jgi:rhodanese-related sulfurtransferase